MIMDPNPKVYEWPPSTKLLYCLSSVARHIRDLRVILAEALDVLESHGAPFYADLTAILLREDPWYFGFYTENEGREIVIVGQGDRPTLRLSQLEAASLFFTLSRALEQARGFTKKGRMMVRKTEKAPQPAPGDLEVGGDGHIYLFDGSAWVAMVARDECPCPKCTDIRRLRWS